MKIFEQHLHRCRRILVRSEQLYLILGRRGNCVVVIVDLEIKAAIVTDLCKP